jgi:preprotein translocase subunit SecG
VYFSVIFTIHCALCVGLIGLVLLQQGKGADAGATFGGGGGGNTVLGTGGADFITKLTTGMAIAFMVTSIMLVNAYTEMPRIGSTVVSDPLAGSVMEKVAPEVALEPVVEPEASSEAAPKVEKEATAAEAVPVDEAGAVKEEAKSETVEATTEVQEEKPAAEQAATEAATEPAAKEIPEAAKKN